jgi:hypothetical protein
MTQRIRAIRLHPKIPIYQNLGDGRDTYISFYNGGFGKYKLTDTYLKEKTESPRHIYHQNLSLCKPTKRYFTDGGGRDTYVYNSLLDENDRCKGNLRLNKILRSYDVTQYPNKASQNVNPSRFERRLIDRIFYGNCPGVKDRQMSPKVKFLKKEDIQKNKEENSLISFEAENENEKNNTISTTKMEKTFEVGNKKFTKYETIGYNAAMTEGNEDTMKNTSEMDFNNSLFKLKKTPKKYKPEFIQSDNLVDSVKKIFLYNSKNNKHLQNNIKIVDLKQKSTIKEPLA